MTNVNPPPLRTPKAFLADPEVAGFIKELTTVIRQLWVRAGVGLVVNDGTESSPGIGFSGELGLGFYRPADNTLGIAADGGTIATFSPDGLFISNLPVSSALYNSSAGLIEGYQLTNGQFLIGSTGADPVAAAPSGTANRITVTLGAGSVAFDISATYVGQTSITTLGTIVTGTWNASTIAAIYGGTGQSSYAVGDILYASTTTALSKLADVATGNALLSGGVNTAPLWGKVGLSTHVSGNLPVAHLNSGTGASATTFWCGDTTWKDPLPQALASGSSPTFNALTLTNGFGCNGASPQTEVTVNAAVTGTAGGAYGATEQAMINDLKDLTNQLRALLIANGQAV